MSLIKIVLSVLLTFPPYYLDKETKTERSDRMETIAMAVVSVADQATCQEDFKSTKEKKCTKFWHGSRDSLIALLLTQGFNESRFSKNVHEGKCKKYECDPYKDRNGEIVHRARTSWQIQQHLHSEKYWDSMVGVTYQPTRIAAGVAATILFNSYSKCKGVKGAIAMYATGQHCSWVRKVPKGTAKKNKITCKEKSKDKKEYDCIDEAQNRVDFYRMTLNKIKVRKSPKKTKTKHGRSDRKN